MDDIIILKDGPYSNLLSQIGKLKEEDYPLKASILFHPKSECYNLALHDLVILLNAKTIVELGSREGYSTDAFIRGLTITNGHLHSFDPVDALWRNNFIKNYENYFTFYKEMGEEGYIKYGSVIRDIDLLYIDTDPHDKNQTESWLNDYWVLNVKKGGYVLLDDCAPQHQENYGCLEALKEYVQQNENKLEYAVVFCNWFDGFGLIKFKED